MEKSVRHHKKITFTKVGIIIAFIVFALYSISLLFPFAWMLINSFRPVDEWQSIINFKDYLSFPKHGILVII
ncbi:MAG: hypothetical protein V8R16_07755 [Bacilli bacterium]